MDIISRLNESTYVVEHNPNCPSPFLVRLVGKGSGMIDKKPVSETKDILGYGETLSEAAFEAFNKRGDVNRELCIDGEGLCEPNKKPAGYCEFCGG